MKSTIPELQVFLARRESLKEERKEYQKKYMNDMQKFDELENLITDDEIQFCVDHGAKIVCCREGQETKLLIKCTGRLTATKSLSCILDEIERRLVETGDAMHI